MAGGDEDAPLVPKLKMPRAPQLKLHSMDKFDFSWDGTNVVIQECWDLHGGWGRASH